MPTVRRVFYDTLEVYSVNRQWDWIVKNHIKALYVSLCVLVIRKKAQRHDIPWRSPSGHSSPDRELAFLMRVLWC